MNLVVSMLDSNNCSLTTLRFQGHTIRKYLEPWYVIVKLYKSFFVAFATHTID